MQVHVNIDILLRNVQLLVVSGDKLVRATELVKLLSLEKSVKGAIKLVTALKLPNLAERFNSILEERLLNESKETLNHTLANSKGNVPIAANITVCKTSVSSEKSEILAPVIPSSSPKLSAPLFIKKVNKHEKEKADQNQTASEETDGNAENTEKVKNAGNANNIGQMKIAGEGLKSQSQRPSNPFSRSSSRQETAKNGDINQVKCQRPSNPFKKSSN
ncbi:conserved hypothetical protein [Ricinus communis]|uniref:WDHD1/CFT4 helical bundle domain-containing protein n=1 Tax=Ricinus communis TaxID=3988 RepID=B9RVD6_RICCO|nr:conserved hypothetical protein [Ricinus communis]